MDLISVLLAVLIVAATVLCAVATVAVRHLGTSARSIKRLADDTHSRLTPLLDKADVTVDALNAELLRVDMLVTRFEDAADRVSQTATTLHEIANAPERIAGGIAEKVRSWRGRKAPARDEAPTQPEPPENEDDTAAHVAVSVDDDQHPTEDRCQQIG